MARAKTPKAESLIDIAASQLRQIVRTTEAGALLGSEETLIAQLGVSRATLRQVARLLEREGLLRVRRGLNGGYFAAKPDVHTIEATVSAYLEMVDTDPEDATAIASALWVELLQKAAGTRSEKAIAITQELRKKVSAVRLDAGFDDVLRVEQKIRTAMFDLVNSRYIELMFQINMAFARRRFPTIPAERDNTPEHREFVVAWRNAKLLEFDAIADGDQNLAALAARHSRNLWHRRIYGEARV